MKRLLLISLFSVLYLGTAVGVYAEDTGCVFRFSEPITEEVRVHCHTYVDVFFKGNYGTDTENLRVVTDNIEAIEKYLDDTDIDYYDFIGKPKFASKVKVAIYADSESFLYEYIDGEIRRVSETSYESDAWTFYTKKLGVYFVTEEEYPESSIDA